MSIENYAFKINQKIEIIDEKITYKADIQDVKRDYIMISMPVSDNKYFLMHRGSVIEFFVTGDKDIDKFKSEVLGKKVENNIQLAILSTPIFIEKIQRREYFRLPVVLDAKLYMLPKDTAYKSISEVPEGYFKKMKEAIIIDISGGGLRAALKEQVIKGHYAIVTVNIPEELMAKESANCYVSKDQSGEQDTVSKVRQKALERSNVDMIEAITDMISIMRSYESNQKVIQAMDETLGKTVNEVGKV